MGSLFTIGVFAIIRDDEDRVLLCHRRDLDLWNLPGGGLESTESPWDGVRREVMEETGLDVEVTALSGVYSKPEKDEVVFAFICTPRSGQITLSEEADEIRYFRIDEIPSNTSPKQVERIRDVLEGYQGVHLKVQVGRSSSEFVKIGCFKA
jgi:8-oxo-dGTP diphosphatase